MFSFEVHLNAIFSCVSIFSEGFVGSIFFFHDGRHYRNAVHQCLEARSEVEKYLAARSIVGSHGFVRE